MAWLQNLGGPGSSCFSKHVGATCKTDSHFQPRTMEQMPSAFSTLSPEFPNLTVFSGFSDRMKQCFSRLFPSCSLPGSEAACFFCLLGVSQTRHLCGPNFSHWNFLSLLHFLPSSQSEVRTLFSPPNPGSQPSGARRSKLWHSDRSVSTLRLLRLHTDSLSCVLAPELEGGLLASGLYDFLSSAGCRSPRFLYL